MVLRLVMQQLRRRRSDLATAGCCDPADTNPAQTPLYLQSLPVAVLSLSFTCYMSCLAAARASSDFEQAQLLLSMQHRPAWSPGGTGAAACVPVMPVSRFESARTPDNINNLMCQRQVNSQMLPTMTEASAQTGECRTAAWRLAVGN